MMPRLRCIHAFMECCKTEGVTLWRQMAGDEARPGYLFVGKPVYTCIDGAIVIRKSIVSVFPIMVPLVAGFLLLIVLILLAIQPPLLMAAAPQPLHTSTSDVIFG